MSPSLESLEKLDVILPDHPGTHPFSKGQEPEFYKELRDKAEGYSPRTSFFEKNLVGLYLALGSRPVPYAFRTRDDKVRSMDAGCVKFLCNRQPPDAELVRDPEGYIVAVKPTDQLLLRLSVLRGNISSPYAHLIRAQKLPFDINDPEDQRRRMMMLQVVRDGAPAFRDGVFGAWKSRCAISGIRIREVLEAAHICPYNGPPTDTLRNAILLRSDLHALFDAFLLSIEYFGNELLVRTSRKLRDSPYAKFEGKMIRLPDDPHCQPALDAVLYHLEELRKAEAI